MAILNPLNDLVAWVIMRIHAVLGSMFGPASGWAWGLSIVILVMLIRLCLVPLFVKQVHAQRKMAQHAPQLQELRKKYKDDKQRLNEETMKFYKENGVNPLAGCLPMIPQMIVFFSLFSVLRAIADWVPGHVPKYGLTVPVVVSAQKATIFGVHLDDKLLFSHPSPSAARGHRDRADRGGQRHDDVHDRPAERQARSHADQRGPGQPDGPVAEVHAVHRPVLLADRAVLAVRPGAVLGDDQPVDAGPAVLHVQELGHRSPSAPRARWAARPRAARCRRRRARPGPVRPGPVRPGRPGAPGVTAPPGRMPPRRPAPRTADRHGQRGNGARRGSAGQGSASARRHRAASDVWLRPGPGRRLARPRHAPARPPARTARKSAGC